MPPLRRTGIPYDVTPVSNPLPCLLLEPSPRQAEIQSSGNCILPFCNPLSCLLLPPLRVGIRRGRVRPPPHAPAHSRRGRCRLPRWAGGGGTAQRRQYSSGQRYRHQPVEDGRAGWCPAAQRDLRAAMQQPADNTAGGWVAGSARGRSPPLPGWALVHHVQSPTWPPGPGQGVLHNRTPPPYPNPSLLMAVPPWATSLPILLPPCSPACCPPPPPGPGQSPAPRPR